MADPQKPIGPFNATQKASIEEVQDVIRKVAGRFIPATTMVANGKQQADWDAGKQINFQMNNSEGHGGFEMSLTAAQKRNLEDALKRSPDFCNNVAFKIGARSDDFNYRPEDNGFGPTLTIQNTNYMTKKDLTELEKRAPIVNTLLDNGLDAAMKLAQQQGLYSPPVGAQPLSITHK